MKHKLILVFCGIVIFILGVLMGLKLVPDVKITLAGLAEQPRDVFGTQTGTTTASTASGSFFKVYGSNASSSKSLALDGRTDTVLLTFRAITASTTSFYEWDILGSNDTGCNTTATSSTDSAYNGYKLSDINWFLADPTNSRVSGRVTNSGTATGVPVLLTDVNWRCLKITGNGSSTTIHAQLKEKSFQ